MVPDVRRSNLSTILNLLHEQGPSSRSVLSRSTGRNRSTIASLVGDLVELGLVAERDPDSSGRVGRPSPVVAIRKEPVAIAVNPEIDAITVGVVGLDGGVRTTLRHEYDSIPTAARAADLIAGIVKDLEAAFSPAVVLGIGVAVPGQVRTCDGVVRHAPHMGWRDEPLGDLLSARIGHEVHIANDASLGALAEHRFGVGRGLNHLVYVNGGASGIGGGVISGGRLLAGAHGYAGEVGHMRLTSSDARDSAGLLGTLEAELSRQPLIELLGLRTPDPTQFEKALLADHSPGTTARVARQLELLGAALAGTIHLLNPEVIALGGYLAALHRHQPGVLQAAVAAATLPASFEGLRIEPAALGPDLLIVGAAQLAFAKVLTNPLSFAR